MRNTIKDYKHWDFMSQRHFIYMLQLIWIFMNGESGMILHSALFHGMSIICKDYSHSKQIIRSCTRANGKVYCRPHKIISVFQKKDFVRMVWGNTEIFVPSHQQKKEIQRKGQERIGRASHGCFSIFVD